MKRLLLHLIFFVAAFAININVRAEEHSWPEQEDITLEPQDCLLQHSTCALKTDRNHRYTLKLSEATIVLTPSTIVVRTGAETLTLVQGAIWVRTPSSMTVQTEYGEILSQSGEFFVVKPAQTTLVRTIAGEVFLKPKAHEDRYEVPPGWQNWMGPINQTRKAAMGVPEALDFKKHLRLWLPLMDQRPEPGILRRLASLWKQAVLDVGQYHHELAKTLQAAERVENVRKAKARAIYETEAREMRQMFKERLLR